MEYYIGKVREKFTEDLARSASEYMTIGLDLFHKYRRSDQSSVQGAIGSLATGVELIIKSYIATRNFAGIFKDLPADTRILLSINENPSPFFQGINVGVDIRSGRYPLLDFEDSIAGFFILFPQMKQPLLPHVEFLKQARIQSLHSVIPELSQFDFERTGYSAIQIVLSITSDTLFKYPLYEMTDYDKAFVKSFESKRVERVEYALLQAKGNMPKAPSDSIKAVVARNWNEFTTSCPVCSSTALLNGYSDIHVERDEDGPYPSIDFSATAMKCSECGLTLNDSEELKLADMPTLFDRAEDLDKWFREHKDYKNWHVDI